MNRFLFFFIIFSLLKHSIFAQNVPWQDFVPEDPRFFPIVKIKVVIHILQKNDGSNNFQDNEEDKLKILKILNHADGVFANLQPARIGNAKHIQDSRIRIAYDKNLIYFHQNDKYNDLSCIGVKGTCGLLMQEIYRELIEKNPKFDPNALHIFFGEGEEGKGEACGIGCKRWAYITGAYRQILKGNHWDSGTLLAHEIGHNLGLHHTVFKGRAVNDFCDDTPTFPENPDCWNGEKCSNNMMDYNADKSALTPCQLGRIHYFIHTKAQGDIKDVVQKDWCFYQNEMSVTIYRGENITLKGETRLQGDLYLEPKSTLTISGTLHLPANAKVIVAPQSKLIVNGEITNLCKDNWQGIFPQNRKKQKNFKEQIEIHGELSFCEKFPF